MSSLNYALITLDEICLEGLDGITLQALWIRLSDRFETEIPCTLKERFWNIVIQLKDVDFFLLPEPRPDLEPFHRFLRDKDKYITKTVTKIEDSQTDLYPFVPIADGYGSCQYYTTRIDITAQARNSSLEDAVQKWGNSLVIVGSLQARWNSLAPNVTFVLHNLQNMQYCLLERIGRTRYNGDLSINKLHIKDEDPKRTFYHKKVLIQSDLVTKRHFYCKVQDSVVFCLIFHLPRFHRNYVSIWHNIIDTITDYLKTRPNQAAPVYVINSIISAQDKSVKPKKLIAGGELSKLLTRCQVKYRDLYLDSEAEEKEDKDHSNSYVAAIRLCEPDEQLDDNDLESNNWEVAESGYVGECLHQQAYKFVYDAGSTGVTQAEIADALGVDHLSARTVLKHISSIYNLQMCLIDKKRQRVTRFVCPEFFKPNNDTHENTVSLSTMKNESVFPVKSEDSLYVIEKNNVNMESDVESKKQIDQDKTNKIKNVNRKKSMLTSKTLRLYSTILEQVKRRHIINDLSNLLRYFNKLEESKGFHNGLVDKHTLLRNVRRLEEGGKIRYIQIKLPTKYNSRKLEFICEPHIDSNHPFIQSVLDQSKLLCQNSTAKKPQLTLQNLKVIKELNSTKKFVKMRLLHKFIYYVVYGHENKVGNIQDIDPNFSLECLQLSASEVSTVYENAPEKMMFVPPLQKHNLWPDGWFYLVDLLFSLPLWLFVKLVSVSHVIPSLVEYYKHPFKCQILVKNLPKDIQNALFLKRKYIFSVYETLERLCLFGLIKFGERIMKEKERVFIYINRNARIYDTTVSSPSYVQVEDRDYNFEKYKFTSVEDVDEYWSRLQYICLNSKLGCHNMGVGKQVEYQTPEVKLSDTLKSVSIEEASASDDGSIPGDHRGAGGFDSCFYTHIKKSWALYDLPIKSVKKQEAEAKARSLPPVARKPSKKHRIVAKMNNGIIVKTKGKHFVRTVIPRRCRKIRKPEMDDIDKQALKNLTTVRSIWSPKEDRLMVIMKTAIDIMFRNCKFIPISTVRDLLHYATHNITKTSLSCQRRIMYMKKKNHLMRNVEIYITEIKQNTNVCQRYLNYYSRKYTKNSSDKNSEFFKECRIHFIELFHYLHRIFYNSSGESKKFLALPTKIQEVYDKYNIDLIDCGVTSLLGEPSNIMEIKYFIIRNIIHVVLSCEHKKLYSKNDFFQLYSQFSEDTLRDAIQKIKSCGMVAMKKKNKGGSNNTASEVSRYFHMSQSYIFQACTNTPHSMFAEMFNHIKNIIENQLKVFKVKDLDSGYVALLIDLNDADLIDLSLTVPKNLLIVDPRLTNFIDQNPPPNEIDNSAVLQDDDKSSTYFNVATRYTMSSLHNIGSDLPAAHTQDFIAINSCELDVTLKCDLEQEFCQSFKEKTDDLFAILTRNIVFDYNFHPGDCFSDINNFDVELTKEIYNFIDSKQHMGAQNFEIKSHFPAKEKKILEAILASLECYKFILRVGILDTRWISINYIDTWFVKLPEIEQNKNLDQKDISAKRKLEDDEGENPKKKPKLDENAIESDSNEYQEKSFKNNDEKSNQVNDLADKMAADAAESKDISNAAIFSPRKILYYLNPRPWLKLNGNINKHVLWRWSAAILSHMINHPVMKLTDLQKRFSHFFPHHIRLLVEMLAHMGCVRLILISTKSCSFWDDSEDQPVIDDASVLDDDNKVYVEILRNALITFTLYRGYSTEMKKYQ